MSKPNPITFEKLLKILLIIFACLTIISALTIYYTHQLPTQETQTTSLCTYIHKGTYRYVAELKPNLIYNKTTLTPEDNATLYTTIVKYINLTFTYTFNINPQPENILIEHQITVQIESPGKWPSRTLKPEEAQEMLQLSGNLNWTMQVNITRIRQFVEAIDKEIFGATRSTTYNININPKIHVEANITTQNTIKKLDETFTPMLTIAFKTDTEKGNYIAIENLNQTKPGKITETQQIPIPQVQTQRTASLTATAITASALTASAILYMFKKPPTPPEKATEKQLKKLIDPYKELIAKTTQKPPKTENTIEVETLEDLAKIAEILARPILHRTEAKEHTFYIIDNNTKYQYKTII